MLIHCGDLTMDGFPDEFVATIAMLRQHPAPLKLVIAGSHDGSLVPLLKPGLSSRYEAVMDMFHAARADGASSYSARRAYTSLSYKTAHG